MMTKRVFTVVAGLMTFGLILSLAGTANAALTDGLVGYWAFDDSGSLGADKSGNGYAGTAQGDASYSASGFLGAGALDLDGASDYMQLPDMGSEFSNSASLSVWIKLTNATPSDGSRTGFMDFDNGSNSHYTWTNGGFYCALFRSGGRYDNIASHASIDRAAWHLVTVVSDPTEGYKIYQNDQQIFSTTQPGFGLANWRLGTQNGAWLDGMIDEAGLWNRALTATDVSDLYNSGAGLNFFFAVADTLTWDGDTGNWGDQTAHGGSSSHWLGGAADQIPQIFSPTSADEAIINSGAVTVAADRGAGVLTINGGSLGINSGTTLEILQETTVAAPGTLNIGGTLKMNTGSLVQVDTFSSGTPTIENAGAVTASHLVMPTGTATFVKTGVGKLSFDQSGGTNNVGAGSTVRVDIGELYMQAASNPLGGQALNLNGGTFTVRGAVSAQDGIEETIFNGTIGNAQTDIETFRTAAQNIGTADGQGILTGHLHYQDDNAVSARAAALGAVGFNNGSFAMLWVADFTPDEDGAWGFRHVGAVDDNDSFWIDTDGNGTFELANRFFNRGCCGASGDQFTSALTNGQTYKLGIVMNDGGGGGWLRDMEFKAPSGTWTDLNPTASSGYFTYQALDAVDMTSSPVSVTDDSTLNAITDATAAFGALSYDIDGKTLTTTSTGSLLTFTGTTFAGGVTNAGIAPGVHTKLGDINDGGSARTITKTGLADLTLDQVSTSLGSTTFNVQEGRLHADYTAVNPVGGAVFVLSGGTLAATGTGVDLQTTVTVDNLPANGMEASGFMLNGRNDADLNLDGNGGLLAQTPAGTTEMAEKLEYNGDAVFRALIPEITRNDDYQSLFRAKLNAEGTLGDPAQNYELRFDWSDDRGFMWVDLDRDGIFELSGAAGNERISWEDHGTKTISLEPGKNYDVAFGHAEHSGGSNFRVWVKAPSMGAQELVDPSAASQDGLWTILPASTLDLLADTTTSNLRDLVLKTGNLRITGGTQLTVEQASVSTGTSGEVGLITETETILTNVSGLNGNGQTVTIAKSGAADLIMNKAGSGLGSATFNAQQGRLIGVAGAAANPFGAGSLALSGGELVLAGDAAAARTYDNALQVNTDSTLTAGAGGQGVSGAAITLGSAGNGVAINGGTLTAQTADSYSLTIAGPVTGSGALNVASPITVEKSINVGTLDLNAQLTRTGVGTDRNITAANFFLRTGTLTMASGETLDVATAASVEGGSTLTIDGNMTGAGGVTVATGSTLAGVGNIANPVTVQSGGILGPGASPGTLNTGSLTIDDGGIFNWELGDDGGGSPLWDQVNVTGNLDLNTTWNLRLNDDSAPLTTGDLLLFSYTGTGNVGTANFDTTAVDALSNWYTSTMEIFHDTTNKDVYLRNLVVTGPSSGDLTWDGATADWHFVDGTPDSHWDGGALDQIPDAAVTATVNSGKSTVGTADAAAHTLTLGGGEVEIASGRRLDVTAEVFVNGGLLDVQGTLDANVNVNVGSGGTLDVAGAGYVEALALNSSGTTTFQPGSTGNIPTLNVSGGTTTLSTPTVPEVNLSGGSLNVNADLPVERLNVTAAGTANTGANHVVVSEKMALGAVEYTIDAGNTFKAGGTVNATAPGRLRLTGGTLTIDSGGGEMPTGNVLWLDANDIQGDGTPTADGVPVTTWADKSGAGHNVTNGGDPATIVFTDGTINNQAAVRLDGNDWIKTNLNIDASVRQDVTIFAVYDYRQVNGDDSLWGQENGGWDRFTLLNHGAGVGVSHGGGMYVVSEMGQAGIGFVINEIEMEEGVGNGSHVLINGNAPSNGGIFTMNNSAGGPANLFAIGAQNANSGTWPTMMDVAEFLVFERVLTAEEQDNVGGYLAGKYGISSGYTGGFGDPLSLTSTDVYVEQTATLNVQAPSAALGNLTLENGVLTTQGPTGGMSFTATAIDSGASGPGFNTTVNTSTGPINGGGYSGTIVKSGGADLIVQGASSNLGSATFDVQAGRIVGMHGSDPLNGATIQLAGGNLVLSRTAVAPATVAFNTAINVNQDGSITAGNVTGGATDAGTVNLGGSGKNVHIAADKTLTLDVTDGYTLNLAGQINSGNMSIPAGIVGLNGGGAVKDLTVASGATVSLGAPLTIDDGGTATLDETTISTSGAPLQIGTTSNLLTTQTLNVSGGTVTVSSGGGMPSGLQLWLDASDIDADGNPDSLSNGDLISVWSDKSGNGNDADDLQSDPSYVASGPNGAPVVNFDNGDRLATTASFDDTNLPDGYTILGVSRYAGGGSTNRVISSRNRNWLFGHHGSRDERWYANGWIHDTGDANTNWHLYAGTMADGNNPGAWFWKDSNLLTSNDQGGHDTDHEPARIQLNGYNGNSELSNSEIAELLIFNGVLSDDDLNNIGGYLADKYGITAPNYTGSLSGPINLPDTDIVVTGDNAILDLGATPTSATFGDLLSAGGAFSFYITGDDWSVVDGLAATWDGLANVTRNDDGLGTTDYAGDTRVDAWLTVVPEPSTFALALFGLVGLLGWRRRRR